MENSFLAHPLIPSQEGKNNLRRLAATPLALVLPRKTRPRISPPTWDQKGGTLLKQKKAPSNGGG